MVMNKSDGHLVEAPSRRKQIRKRRLEAIDQKAGGSKPESTGGPTYTTSSDGARNGGGKQKIIRDRAQTVSSRGSPPEFDSQAEEKTPVTSAGAAGRNGSLGAGDDEKVHFEDKNGAEAEPEPTGSSWVALARAANAMGPRVPTATSVHNGGRSE